MCPESRAQAGTRVIYVWEASVGVGMAFLDFLTFVYWWSHEQTCNNPVSRTEWNHWQLFGLLLFFFSLSKPELKLVKKPGIPKLSQASVEKHWDPFFSISVHLQAKYAPVTGRVWIELCASLWKETQVFVMGELNFTWPLCKLEIFLQIGSYIGTGVSHMLGSIPGAAYNEKKP